MALDQARFTAVQNGALVAQGVATGRRMMSEGDFSGLFSAGARTDRNMSELLDIRYSSVPFALQASSFKF